MRQIDKKKWDERRRWNWSKPDSVLAGIHKMHKQSIRQIRIKLKIPKVSDNKIQTKLRLANERKWRLWDWSKQDIELCGDHGITRERVRQIRKLLGKPKSLLYKKFRKTRAVKRLFQDLVPQVQNKSFSEILKHKEIKRLNLGRCSIRNHLKAAGIPFRKDNVKWIPEEVNWHLPNCILSKIYNWISPQNFPNVRRKRNLTLSFWDGRLIKPGKYGSDLMRLIGEEKQTAKEMRKRLGV